ncbi:hypothetical protein OOK60_08695 [Trichothermofontia sichuanensis B231]|uniref:hypothetical protein n=1 Tax=Trichothermofontia sichuanensis TaxID=3045816 RepID=UPI002246CF9F|nr:hypothetical protein [Trichothermofontia sichuanensis]UZQ56114.1 hypothetical protein OOK60_08695 [Trichothermofontia sichuanensis B231]
MLPDQANRPQDQHQPSPQGRSPRCLENLGIVFLTIATWGASALAPGLAQTPIWDALPPPPPAIDPNAFPPATVPSGTEFDFSPTVVMPDSSQSVYTPPPSLGTIGNYVVIIDNSSPQLLSEVQRVVPDAFIRSLDGRSVIQAGLFRYESNAIQQANTLAASGFTARVLTLTNAAIVTPPPVTNPIGDPTLVNPLPPQVLPPIVNPQPPVVLPARVRAYFVVIPGRQDELAFIANRVRGLGGNQLQVVTRLQPRGPHVAIGPYERRSQAEFWNNFLQSSGFRNSRVYFGY